MNNKSQSNLFTIESPNYTSEESIYPKSNDIFNLELIPMDILDRSYIKYEPNKTEDIISSTSKEFES